LHVGDPGGWEAADPSLGVEAAVLFGKTIFGSLSGNALGYVAGALRPITGDVAHGFLVGVFACVELRTILVNDWLVLVRKLDLPKVQLYEELISWYRILNRKMTGERATISL